MRISEGTWLYHVLTTFLQHVEAPYFRNFLLLPLVLSAITLLLMATSSIIVEFKNSIVGIISLPFVELAGYAARLHTRVNEQLYLGRRIPCLGLTIGGKLVNFICI